MAELVAWLRARKYWVAATPKGAVKQQQQQQQPPLTHVFLNGGRACVPAEARGEFLDAYADVVSAGGCSALYAVERSGTEYRMFADFDVPLASIDSRTSIQNIVDRALAHAPGRLREGRVAVCLRPAHDAKVGAHLVWSDVRVDDAIAVAARDEWVASLVKASEQADIGMPWDAVIDAAVYRRNGLRMPWSMKRGCDMRSCYTPWAVYDMALEVPTAVERVTAKDSGAMMEDGGREEVRRWLSMTTLEATFGETKGGSATNKKTTTTKTTTRKRKEGEDAGQHDEVCMLRAALPPQYADCDLRAVKDGIVRSDSRCCLIAGREHSSNNVYFVRKADGSVRQWCFSQKCAGQSVEVVAPSVGDTKNNKKKKKKSINVKPVTARQAAERWVSFLCDDLKDRPAHQ